MPVFKSQTIFDAVRGIRAYLHIEGVIARIEELDSEQADAQSQGLAQARTRLARQRQVLKNKDQEITQIKAELDSRQNIRPGGVSPDNLIWIFGYGRTGSTWLSAMMKEIKGHAVWFEPSVGELFGDLYYTKARVAQRASRNYILGNLQKKTWLKSIRSFVLEGADGRFPNLGEKGYVVIKEPHGSIGAPLLMEALPESRMVLLLRDPRDAIASSLDAFKEGNWAYQQTHVDGIEEVELATDRPDDFVRMKADRYLRHMGNAREAYGTHGGPKSFVKYEDLRADTLNTMKRIYAELEIPVDEEELARAVTKHSWENVPEESRGEGKFHRKAAPGSWEEDLTPRQVEIVERITAPLLNDFYPA